jgi:hypothetical protein
MGWWGIIFFIGSLVLGYLLRPKMNYTAPKPAGIDEFDFPTASPGREIPVVFGTRWVRGPNVVWYGHLKVDPIYSSSGGKK